MSKPNNNRPLKIWVCLVASMTAGALVLMSLDNHKISAGAFSLASFQRLGSIQNAAKIDSSAVSSKWDSIQVVFSGTTGGSLENIALAQGNLPVSDVDLHFLICNGLGGDDGLILSSQRWQKQINCSNKAKTIEICIVSDGVRTIPTNTQLNRTSELVEHLARVYSIKTSNIHYPVGSGL